jgi:poly-beta-1,6-N-acetyl-D-glucosamine synthase
MILTAIVILLFISYASLILYYWRSWMDIPSFHRSGIPPSTQISVVIPARNEAENIGLLLQSLTAQSYPAGLFEIIVVDDHSIDHTADIVRSFTGVRLVQLAATSSNSYKKMALDAGVRSAKGHLIVTTDADCHCPKDWLSTLAALFERDQPVFIVAPVSINRSGSLVGVFQDLDFTILQGITGGSVHRQFHSMCNGANLAYTREAFEKVNGFSGIDDIASGDDMLLMHKIWKHFPGRISYLKSKEAIVNTQPMRTWQAFFQQRIRWASKATRFDDKRITAVLLLVYFFNASFLVLVVAGFFNHDYWWLALILWVAKTIVEWPFMDSITRFFSKRYLVAYFFFLQPIHITYTILSGLFGQFGKYEWKGRRVK